MNKTNSEHTTIKEVRGTYYIEDKILPEYQVMGYIDYSMGKDKIQIVYKGGSGQIKIPKKYRDFKIPLWWYKQRVSKIINHKSINYIKLFKTLNLDSGFLYYTSYGFGYSLISGIIGGEKFKKEIEEIKDFLNKKGIEYKNEVSQGGWVYRFKISQSEENINKLRRLKNG